MKAVLDQREIEILGEALIAVRRAANCACLPVFAKQRLNEDGVLLERYVKIEDDRPMWSAAERRLP